MTSRQQNTSSSSTPSKASELVASPTKKSAEVWEEVIDNASKILENVANGLEKTVLDELRKSIQNSRSNLSGNRVFRLGVAGPGNVGKTTFLKTLFFDSALSSIRLPTLDSISTFVTTVIRVKPSPVKTPIEFTGIIFSKDVINNLILEKLLDLSEETKVNFNPKNNQPIENIFEEYCKLLQEKNIPKGVKGEIDAIERAISTKYFKESGNKPKTQLFEIKDAEAMIVSKPNSYIFSEFCLEICSDSFVNPIEIVDLPGFNVANVAHQKASEEALSKLDGLIYIKRATPWDDLSEKEKLFLPKIRESFGLDKRKFLKLIISHYIGAPYNKYRELEIENIIKDLDLNAEDVFKTSSLYAFVAKSAKQNKIDPSKDDFTKNIQGFGVDEKSASHIPNLLKKCSNNYDAFLEEIGFKKLEDSFEEFFTKTLPTHLEDRDKNLALSTLREIKKALALRQQELQIQEGENYLRIRHPDDKERQRDLLQVVFSLSAAFDEAHSSAMTAAEEFHSKSNANIKEIFDNVFNEPLVKVSVNIDNFNVFKF